ncbi:MAG: ABC transporter substrate-binding protein [Dermatophilaceae bacterium]
MGGSDGMDTEPLDVRMLGPLQAWRGGQELPLGGRRQRAILACLLLDGHGVVSTERIADAVWAGAPPSGYLATIQTYVFHLRETLEPGRAKGTRGQVLVTVPGGYRLDVRDERVDARRFERLVATGRRQAADDPQTGARTLRQALDLWRGDVLSDLCDVQIVATESRRLTEVYVGAVEAWADAELALGHHETLAPELGRLVAEHPLRERLHAQRMLALYRGGRQAEALAAYRQLRTTLDDELGVEPSSDVRALHERILRQDPALLWRPTGPEPAPPAPGADTVVDTGMPSAKPSTRPPAGVLAALRRRWLAVGAVVVVAAGLLVGTVVTGARAGVTPVPPNSAALITDHGLAGQATDLRFTPVALATGAGAVWAADESDDALVKIDPESRRIVETVHGVGGSPHAVAVSTDDVWVAGQGESVVTRFNIRTDKVVDKVAVGIEPAALVASGDAVWVANTGDNTVQRIDIAAHRVDPPVRVGDGPAALALDGTTLWIANSRSASVTQLDTRTGQRIASDIRVDAGPRSLALTPTDLWVANELGQSVSRVNRATAEVTRVPVDDGPAAIVIVDGQPWVANASSATVSRIEPATNAVSSIDMGSSPQGLALLGSDVWVATSALGNAEHVGGTVVVEGVRDGSATLDPASNYVLDIVEMLRPVYDGLVAFRAVGGRASTTVVPDLATSLPTPTDGGRTYVFTLRDGIRYSTGATVVATDVALGLRRAILSDPAKGNPSLFRSIVGAAQCMDERATPDRCDLSQGVDADDATRRVTIRLVEPDPELLYKLTFFVVPAPPGTPTTDLGRTPLPGTGPYAVASSGADGSITLVRNPNFRQWSAAAQPQGYPDEIQYRFAESDAAVADVLAGRADVVPFVPPSIKNPGQTHPALVHKVDTYNTDFAYLNARLAPFDDVRVRRALNDAVDRRTFTQLYGGGDGFASVSCQMLPPAFPGYRRYCPYQTGAADGPYLGPDLETAKRLVAESGAASTPVTVHSYRRFGLWQHFADYLATVLRQIGFTSVRVEDIPAGITGADPAYASYQIFTQQGWLPDYPVASSFYDFLVSCRQASFSGYCNREIDEIARRAFSLEQSDPNTAVDLWAQVDWMLTDDAAFVTLGNRPNTQLVSERVGNYVSRPQRVLLSQLWVQ